MNSNSIKQIKTKNNDVDNGGGSYKYQFCNIEIIKQATSTGT